MADEVRSKWQAPMCCSTEALDIGMDCVSSVCDEYVERGLFKFTGENECMTLHLGDEHGLTFGQTLRRRTPSENSGPVPATWYAEVGPLFDQDVSQADFRFSTGHVTLYNHALDCAMAHRPGRMGRKNVTGYAIRHDTLYNIYIELCLAIT